jgi:hypothetical protein
VGGNLISHPKASMNHELCIYSRMGSKMNVKYQKKITGTMMTLLYIKYKLEYKLLSGAK